MATLAPLNLAFGVINQMQKLILLSGLAVLSVMGVLLVDRSEKRRALRHVAGRESLSESQFANRYFSGDRIPVAEKLWGILSRHLSIDLSRLHPDDRLVEDLRLDALDSMSTVEFVLDVEKELNVTIPNEAAEKMLTFRQVVEFVSARSARRR